MGLRVQSDSSRPGGGYALLRSDAAPLPQAVSVEDRSEGQFLGLDGRWHKTPTALAIEVLEPGLARMGPTIVDHLETDMALALRGPDGRLLDHLTWPGVRPSALRGETTPVVGSSEPTVTNFVPDTPEPPTPDPVQPPEPPPPEPPTPEPPTPEPPTPEPPPPPPEPSPAETVRPPSPPRWRLLAVVAALVVLALAALAHRLVCAPEGTQWGGAIGALLAVCAAPADDELAAWTEHQNCAAVRVGCDAGSCSAAYLQRFPAGAHVGEVRRRAAEAASVCAAADFARFNECLARATSCEQSVCADRFASSLAGGPFASSLRRARAVAEAACAAQKEADAYAVFSRCLTAAAECDKAKCAANYPPHWRNGAYKAKIDDALDAAAAACRTETAKKKHDANSAAFQACLRGADACGRTACVDRWRYLLTDEPYASDLRRESDRANAACAVSREQAAFADFNRCVAGARDCDKAQCGAQYATEFRYGDHRGEIDRNLAEAARACEMSHRPTPEQAAHDFVLRYYRAHSSDGHDRGELPDLYPPIVKLFDQPTPRDKLLAALDNWYKDFRNLEFAVDESTLVYGCDAQGLQCSVEGEVASSYEKNGAPGSGRMRFSLKLVDVLSNPKVLSESSKKAN